MAKKKPSGFRASCKRGSYNARKKSIRCQKRLVEELGVVQAAKTEEKPGKLEPWDKEAAQRIAQELTRRRVRKTRMGRWVPGD